MADVLIRDVPEQVAAALAARAAQLGFPLGDYVRRVLIRDAAPGAGLGAADLARFSSAFEDLGDPTIMGSAWR
jgi:plasmid stability protein